MFLKIAQRRVIVRIGFLHNEYLCRSESHFGFISMTPIGFWIAHCREDGTSVCSESRLSCYRPSSLQSSRARDKYFIKACLKVLDVDVEKGKIIINALY
jgi:hypothetical protein